MKVVLNPNLKRQKHATKHPVTLSVVSVTDSISPPCVGAHTTIHARARCARTLSFPSFLSFLLFSSLLSPPPLPLSSSLLLSPPLSSPLAPRRRRALLGPAPYSGCPYSLKKDLEDLSLSSFLPSFFFSLFPSSFLPSFPPPLGPGKF